MSYVKCNACPSTWDCGTQQTCLNCLVTAAHVHKALDDYDKMVEANRIAREASPIWHKDEPKKVVDVKPICWHTYSDFGICMKCGEWKT